MSLSLSDTIVGISCAIIVILFLGQQFGTSKIGYSFAPIMVVFFGLNSVIGVFNIVKYSPSIFKAGTLLFRAVQEHVIDAPAHTTA